MTILALDPGTKCGWAIWDGKEITSGVQDFSLKRGESRGMMWIRLKAWLVEVWVNTLHAGHPIELVCWEQPHHRGGAATEIAYGFVTRFHEFAAVNDLETCSVHSGTLKKFATGNGHASKSDMDARACNRGWDPKDDNECDALWVLEWARQEVGEGEDQDRRTGD